MASNSAAIIDLPPAAPNGRTVIPDLGIRIDRDGIWYYHGSPIRRKELICLFASTLRRDEDGGYWLVTPAEMGQVEVEDVPFIAVEVFKAGDGPEQIISVRTNTDEVVTVDEHHGIDVVANTIHGEATPYVRINPQMQARILRAPFYELVDLGVERVHDGCRTLGVWSSGSFFPLGELGPDV